MLQPISFTLREIAAGKLDSLDRSVDRGKPRLPETRIGQAYNTSSVRVVMPDRSRSYAFPSRLNLNEWALAGRWRMTPDSATSEAPQDRIAFCFHASDLHLVMGPLARPAMIPFRVMIDGKPPVATHSDDIDSDGYGLLDCERVYHLIRQVAPIEDRRIEIEFLEPGAKVFAFKLE